MMRRMMRICTKLLLCAALVLALVLVVVPAMETPASAAIQVSGKIYASQLNDNTLVLTGDTELVMDTDKVFRSISGDYALTVTGSSKLTVWSDWSDSSAISVKSLKVTTDMLASSNSTRYCIDVKNDIELSGKKVEISGVAGIRSSGGNIEIKCDDLNVAVTQGSGIVADGGSVTVDAAKLSVETKAEGNDKNPCGFYARDNLNVFSGEGLIIGKTYGVYSANGDIEMTGIISTGSEEYGVCSDGGKIILNGTFYVNGGVSALRTEKGDLQLIGDITLRSSEDSAIYTTHYVYVNGKLDVRCDASDAYAIYVMSTINIKGSECKISGNGGGILAQYGEVIIDSDTINIMGGAKAGIVARSQGSVVLTGDNIVVLCNQPTRDDDQYHQGIYAKDSVTIKCTGKTWVEGREGITTGGGSIKLEGGGEFEIQGIGNALRGNMVWVKGSLRTLTTNESGKPYGISCSSFHFDGPVLTVKGGGGINAEAGDVHIVGGTVNITVTGASNHGIYAFGGISLEGNVTVTSAGSEGIKAEGIVTLGKGAYKVTGCNTNYRAIYGMTKLVIDPSLNVVVPEGGRNDGMCIVTTRGTRATEVELYTAISDVSIYVDGPVAGRVPINKSYQIQGLGTQMALESITWYEDGVKMAEGQTFVAGKTYTADIVLTSTGGERFVGDKMAMVNGKSVSTGTARDKLYLTGISFGKCPNSIGKVELTLTAPAEGQTPSTTVGAGTGYGKDSIQWQMSADGEGYYNMSTTTKFEGGKYYRAIINIRTSASNYKFATSITSAGVEPNVEATVNGGFVAVGKTSGKEPDSYITVICDFGKCNDSIIEEITIVDVVAPVAGQTPSYTFNIKGTGYHINLNKNAYEDIYWKNPPEKWYYIVDGVRWVDVTDGGWKDVYEHDMFLPGHEYRVTVYVRVDDGYEFAHGRYYSDTLVTATLNGNTAEVRTGHSDYAFSQEISYTFTCPQKEVDRIEINDIDLPVGGQLPDYTGVEGNADEYLLDFTHGIYKTGVFWYDCEGRMLDPDETFRKGESYLIQLRIVSNSFGDAELCKFSEDVRVFINGQEVSSYGWWDDIDVTGNVVNVYYTFRNPAAAPELPVPVGGDIRGNGQAVKPVVKLYAAVDTALSNPLYTAQVGDAMPVGGQYCWSYSFDGVPRGNYILVVTKTSHDRYSMVVEVTSDNLGLDTITLNYKVCSHRGGSATCTQQAVCSVCGEYYGSLNENNHTQSPRWSQTAVGHTVVYPCCRVQQANETHQWSGSTCTVCGYSCVHRPMKVAGQAASCVLDGWKDYYQCGCGQYFEDEACTKAIPELSRWKTGDGKLAMTDHADLNQDLRCDTCGKDMPNQNPTVTEPSVTEPSVTEPSVTEPSVTEPSVTEPSVTEPSATEPGVTEPSVTEPGVTEPSVTEPGVTEPSEQQPSGTMPTNPEKPEQVKPEQKEEEKSSGAVVGIAIAATAVLGAGGFGVYWFVIKKRKR